MSVEFDKLILKKKEENRRINTQLVYEIYKLIEQHQ